MMSVRTFDRVKDLSVGLRVLIVALLPMLGMLGLSGQILLTKRHEVVEMGKLAQLAALVNKISAFTHELQKERGMSSVLISSQGAQFRSEVDAQRRTTDAQKAVFEQATTTLDAAAFGADFARKTEIATRDVARLAAIRQQISALLLSGPDSFSYYTSTIAELFDIVAEVPVVIKNTEVPRAVMADFLLMEAKESAGQERATGAQGFAAGKFNEALLRRFIFLGSLQDTFFRLFDSYASAEERALLEQTLTPATVAELQRLRKIAAEGGLAGELQGVTGQSWWQAATDRIDLMKKVEDRLAANLAATSQRVSGAAVTEFNVVLVIVLGLLIVSVPLAMLMIRSIVGPIKAMTGAMTTLAGGDLEIAVPALGQRDEIGAMAAAVGVFKSNAVETRRLTAEQRREQARKEERTTKIEAYITAFQRRVAEALAALTSASTEMRAAAESMTGIAQETSRQLHAVVAASEQASANVQTVAAATEEMATSISEIGRQAGQSSEIAVTAVADAERTTNTMRELAAAAQKIGAVISLIHHIARQTNLLALNATIEAARAGDAGKGFAVVASEVKLLANQTGSATDEIRDQIGGMQSVTQEAVAAIERVYETINRMNQIVATIAAAVGQQTVTTREITRNTQEAARGTEDVSLTMTNVNQAANETGAAAAQVRNSADALARQAEALRSDVGGFLDNIRAA
jgi:methyl-accepting chemotaxis protein